MLMKFALRNVLRNRRRSFLTALAVFFGAMIVGVAQGWINGLVNLFIGNYIVYQTGNVRITTEEYLERERFIPVDTLIPDAKSLSDRIRVLPGVKAVEERIRFGILLGHGDNTVEALGVGLDLEHSAFGLGEKLTAGTLGPEGLYLGKDLAARLGVKMGDELLLATKTSEGGLNGIKLPVAGLVKTGIGMYDKKLFFISLADAKRLLKIQDGTTELYVLTQEEKQTDAVDAAVKSLLPAGLAARTYQEQLGPLFSSFHVMRIMYIFIEALILFLASFVVINTMMMAIFERLHEVGTLKAIGMTDRELFVNFTLEGALIGAAGGIPGALVGYGFVALLHFTGVNMESFMKSVEMPIEYVMHPSISILAALIAVVLSIVVPALAAMIPARYARKLQPAEALRK
ncbi:MAG: FtsX-like permease family protein [candidate division FCPU426 bacterium]